MLRPGRRWYVQRYARQLIASNCPSIACGVLTGCPKARDMVLQVAASAASSFWLLALKNRLVAVVITDKNKRLPVFGSNQMGVKATEFLQNPK